MSDLSKIHLASNNNRWAAPSIFSSESLNMQAATGHYRKDSGSTASIVGFDYDAELKKAEDNCDRLYPVAAKHKGMGQVKKYNDCLKSAHSSTDDRQKDYNKTLSNSQLTNVLGGLAASPTVAAGASSASGTTDNTMTYLLIILAVAGAAGIYLFFQNNAGSAPLAPVAQ